MFRMFALAIVMVGCDVRGSGELCSSSRQCAEGVCLKGVCSGAPCGQDADCGEDQVCGSISGTQSCLNACEGSDDACPGELSCQRVETDLAGELEAEYCL